MMKEIIKKGGATRTEVKTASVEPAVIFNDDELTERLKRRWQRVFNRELLRYGKENDPEYYEWCKANLEKKGFNYAELESDDCQEVLMEGELSFADLNYISELRWHWTFLAYDIDSCMREYTIDDLIETIQVCRDVVAQLREMLTMMGQMSKFDPDSFILPKKPLLIREEFRYLIEKVIEESENTILRTQSLLAKRRRQHKKVKIVTKSALGI